MKLLKVLAATSLALALASTASFADAVKGQKAYIKFLKAPCGMDGSKFAQKHTQDEWREIKEAGKAEEAIIKICPNVKAGDVKANLLEHIMDFSIEFASDSGNVPSC